MRWEVRLSNVANLSFIYTYRYLLFTQNKPSCRMGGSEAYEDKEFKEKSSPRKIISMISLVTGIVIAKK